jgi:hypothetical protein
MHSVDAALPNLDVATSNFQIDSVDPQRVWFFTQTTGTQTGPLVGTSGKVLAEPSSKKYSSPVEVVSVSINEDGLCYR